MSDPFIGEIRIFALNFPPQGWAFCNGRLLSISANTALFSIIGSLYGGNGASNFALPNLQSMVVMGAGEGVGLSPRELGETGGSETSTLSILEMPAHTHSAAAQADYGHQVAPAGNFWAHDLGKNNEYGDTGPAQMAADSIVPIGGGKPHPNDQPYLVLNYCIALQGIFPQRT